MEREVLFSRRVITGARHAVSRLLILVLDPHNNPTRTTGTAVNFRAVRTTDVFVGPETRATRSIDLETSRSCGTPLRQRI